MRARVDVGEQEGDAAEGDAGERDGPRALRSGPRLVGVVTRGDGRRDEGHHRPVLLGVLELGHRREQREEHRPAEGRDEQVPVVATRTS